jgi:RNA polymerase sigma-70 factor (ECF subfamily)
MFVTVYLTDMASFAGMSPGVDQLVIAAQRGSRPAADELVRNHRSWVRAVIYGVIGRQDRIDDVEQQVWSNVWERLKSLQDPARLRPWLYSVARNAAVDYCEGENRRRSLIEGFARSANGAAANRRSHEPAVSLHECELRERLLESIRELPAIYRETFVLRHLEDWSYAQIAETLDISPETVETRLTRARRLLRDRLAGEFSNRRNGMDSPAASRTTLHEERQEQRPEVRDKSI